MKRLLLPFLFAAFVLSGMAGCTFFSRETTVEQEKHAQRYDDAGIKTQIASALLKQDASQANDVNVHCFNGHVFLIGEADKDFRQSAVNVARRTEGVVHVTTHWFPSGTASSSDDSAIEMEIESRLMSPENRSIRRLSVDVWGGHVVLTGLADNQAQIDTAVTRVKQVPEVKSVTSYISQR